MRCHMKSKSSSIGEVGGYVAAYAGGWHFRINDRTPGHCVQEELLDHCDCDGCGGESEGRFEYDTGITYDGTQAQKDACAEKCRSDARCVRSMLWTGGCGLYKTGANSMAAGSSGSFFCYVRAAGCKDSGVASEDCAEEATPPPCEEQPQGGPAPPTPATSGAASNIVSVFVVFGVCLQLRR